MTPKETAGNDRHWKDEQSLISLISHGGPKTFDELSSAFDGEFGFGRTVLSVGHLLLAGKVSILTNGQIALSPHPGSRRVEKD